MEHSSSKRRLVIAVSLARSVCCKLSFDLKIYIEPSLAIVTSMLSYDAERRFALVSCHYCLASGGIELPDQPGEHEGE
jgi:hypothetical protein